MNGERRTALIAKLCAGAEERIRSATSRQEAERIAASACDELGGTCESTLVRRALTAKLETLIAERWIEVERKR